MAVTQVPKFRIVKQSKNFKVYVIERAKGSFSASIVFYHWYEGYQVIELDSLDELRELGDLITAALGEQCDNTLSDSSPVPTSQNTPAKSITTGSATL